MWWSVCLSSLYDLFVLCSQWQQQAIGTITDTWPPCCVTTQPVFVRASTTLFSRSLSLTTQMAPCCDIFSIFFPPLSNKWFKTHHLESYSGTVACSFWWYFNKCDLNQRDTDCDYFFIFSGIILRGECTWITSKNTKSYELRLHFFCC